MDKTFKVITTVEITQERVSDIVCNAFEGGSNYWIDKVKIVSNPNNKDYASEAVAYDGELSIHYGAEEEDRRVVPFGQTQVERGLTLLAELYPHLFQEILNEQDDANTADVFVQLAVLGEVVYG